MDPVSIAGIVGPTLKTLYSVTTTLYTFITSAKKVDKSLENLQNEVRGLTRVLEDIETFLKDVIIAQTKNATLGRDGAWGPIYNAVQDTRHTIEALQKVLDRLGSPRDITNGIKKTMKQIQLNINSEEINDIRSRVQWHSTSLLEELFMEGDADFKACAELALQTATLVINCLTNDNLINVINPKLDGILPLVPKVESLIKQIENLSSQLTDKFVELPEDFQKSQMTENTQQLKRSAGVLIVTATTIIESQSTIVDGKDVQQPSSSSSGQLSEELRERLVEKWISQLTVNHEEMEPDSDITSELMPDDSVSCVALNRDKQPQQVDEAGTPGPSADTTKNAGGTTNMSTGREKSIKTVLEEGSAHLYPFDETSKSSEDLDSDTVSTESLYREDYVAPTSYNEKSTKELLAVLGAKPEAREWKANETLFDLVKMKPGNGVRSSSNMVETLLYLLEKGGDVNAKDVKSRTPLHHASAVGNIAVVQQLIERDAEPNIPDEHGWTALHVAAGTGHTQVVEVLMSGSADIANETERGQATSLHLAAFFGRASTVEYLLKVGASVNTKDMNGCTPLYLASASGHVEVVETLLKAGSSVDTTIKKGHKSLHFASAQGHFGVVETLLKAGASVDAKDIDGRTALQIASARDRVEVVKFLLKTGASVGSKDQNGYSPLHYAVQSGHETTIELLLAAGADINTRSNLNNTVLHRILYRHKQDCDHKTSCAFCAGSETRENIMRLLCEKGADPSVIDDYGNSPLSLIRSEGIYSRTEQKALARVLKKYGAGSFKS